MRYVHLPRRQRGVQVVEYALLIAVVSLSLLLTLPPLGNGICEVGNRVGVFLGATSVTCVEGGGNNGGGNNNGSNNNGGANNPGGGTNPGKGKGKG